MESSTTTTSTRAYVSKAPSKLISIKEGEGGSSSDLIKTTSSIEPKDRGKVILIKQSYQEKNKQQATKLERHRKINSILHQRENDPPSLNKGDPNKNWCYETTEITMLGKSDKFLKMPKKSFETKNYEVNQFDFPTTHKLLTSPQFKLSDDFKNKDEYKSLKIHFHTILGKNKDYVWSLVKIVKLMKIERDVLFHGSL
ncbi:unnamed protein product [Lactuca saligna]|uniref:Uncharacterized protein n=1 Tax=Lactuca saligna TaxID=75948 RepID=A0AA36EAP7_LACSI|nr:unnamed protein product [Lactuca saligna]